MKKKIEKKNIVETPLKTSLLTRYPILIISLKVIFVVAVFIIAINYSDSKGYFNPDESNNHTKKKWDSFYKFSKRNNVDIVLGFLQKQAAAISHINSIYRRKSAV